MVRPVTRGFLEFEPLHLSPPPLSCDLPLHIRSADVPRDRRKHPYTIRIVYRICGKHPNGQAGR